MANKAIFSYGNNGKRKIGHSKFDMGYEHIMSSNFGGLMPAACFETLPDDYWDVSQNTVSLLKPLTAPAFTRINQNWYGAYVRNQQIWKYWNDYISNGTSFGDVYGNNVTNQSLQNAWDVPSIPTPYLQTILKVGTGNATPCFTFLVSCNADGSLIGPSDPILASLITRNCTFYNLGSTPQRITDLVYIILQAAKTQTGGWFDLIRQIDLSSYSFDIWVCTDGTKHYYLWSVYCSLRQWLSLSSVFGIISLTPQNSQNASEIGSSVNDSYSYAGYSQTAMAFRFFADRISPEPKTSTSAFLIEKTDYQSQDGSFLKSLDYYARILDTKVDTLYYDWNWSSTNGDTGIVKIFQCIQSSYWGFRYGCRQYQSDCYIESCNSFAPSNFRASNFYWVVKTNTLLGINSLDDFEAFFEAAAQEIHYLGVAQQSFNLGLDMFARAGALTAPCLVQNGGSNGFICNEFGAATPLLNYGGFINLIAACDLRIYFHNVDSVTQVIDYLPQRSFVSRDSLAMGYDSMSMFVYQCRQSYLLMDNFGIKVDPLSQRPFDNYRFELSNSLPFFAYSKIWQDNFRNSVVSSPELDYSESNSLIFADAAFYQNFVFASSGGVFFLEPNVRPDRYKNKVASDFASNGWTLELTTFPRNSQGSAIHTHLPMKDFMTVLAVLVGHNFDRVFCDQLQTTDLNVYDYYMPSYYNGLLHLKYQNFNKDYFTSALLDPMSGANQVALGSTVNELRQAEAEQHWWERTAMYRSIKSWFQGTYGITPIELPEDSRITGTDHVDVQIGEVIQTSGTTPESPQGTRSGLGGCRGSGSLCHGHANEHGWIIILCSHTIESQYTQVYDKMWDVKESFLDYPTIDFAAIGNESILEKELNYTTMPVSFFDYNFDDFSSQSTSIQYLPTVSSSSVRYKGQTNPIRKTTKTSGYFNVAQSAGTSLDNIFGFIPRYSSYKFKFDQVSGQFRHELNFWHTFKRYLTNPILCHEFVNWEMAADDDDINRIFAVSDDFLDDKFAIDAFINASVDRALPFVCVPMSK